VVKIESTVAQFVVEGYLNMFLIERAFIKVKRMNIPNRKIKQQKNTTTLWQRAYLAVT
jgi:hypothetical protein